MTRAIDHLQSAYLMGIKEGDEAHKKWVAISFKIADITGNAHLLALQQIGRLDLMLRQVERERVEAIQSIVSAEIDLSLDLEISLAISWVLRTYEIMRAGKEQLKRRSQYNPKFIALEYRLAIVRMPISKGEIQGMNIGANKQSPLLLFGEGDPAPLPYEPDGSYIAPCLICAATGAVAWRLIDVKARRTITISRRDLSDELLRVFD